ncbi:MAG: hypothetical protein GX096_14300 [Clostridiales bacterium]|nr:hypothetical protein [Clostridiales bacterium]
MPTAIAYRRTPLTDPAYVQLSDSAVHIEGQLAQMIKWALAQVDVTRMSPLDAVLATKLGGYTQAPPMPDVKEATALLPGNPAQFIQTMRAATLLASMGRDKQAMLEVLSGMQSFMDAMPQITEEALFMAGADALRLTVELYRRTGQRFLLALLKELRAHLPDVSGVMHSFPFQRDYRQTKSGSTAQEIEYYERMQRMATGKLTADALSMTAHLAQFSGSKRDSSASRAGLAALGRFHGMPCGAFSADPFLAGRDPARAVELSALGAQIEAYADALCVSGDRLMADALELLLVNALPDMLFEDGIRALQPTNRLFEDDTCQIQKPTSEDVTALLRSLYALHRSVWLAKDEDTLAYMLPVAGGCITRLAGVPIRFTAAVSGTLQKTITIRTESKEPVRCNLELRIPAYADAAAISVNGSRPEAVLQDEMYTLSRTFQSGDVITLTLNLSPRLEVGYRASVSVFVGSTLMALSLPNARAAWKYAVVSGSPLGGGDAQGAVQATVVASEAPMWKEKAGFVLPPPQGVPMSQAYELTLVPYAGTKGRIAAFPCVTER